MQLVLYPDNILTLRCKEVNYCSQRGRAALAAAMWKTMYRHNGAGLAAPQVGFGVRMFVWRCYGRNNAIWNPIIYDISGTNTAKEQCLSLPGISVEVERSSASRMIGTGVNGKKLSLWGNSNDTRIWQHEIDHLDGKLIIDNMSNAEAVSNQNALKILIEKSD